MKNVQWDRMDQAIYKMLSAEIGEFRGKKVLELLPGTGKVSLKLASENAEVTLMGSNEEQMQELAILFEEHNCSADYYYGNILDMSHFSDHSFDAVWNLHALEYFDYEFRIQILKELKRVVKPEGLIITCNTNSNNALVGVGKWFLESSGKWEYGENYAIHSLTREYNEVEIANVKEYSICFEDSLTYFSALPNAQFAASALEQWFNALPKNSQQQVEGFLLVSVAHNQSKESWPVLRSPEKSDESSARKTVIILCSIHFSRDLWQRPQHLAVQLVQRGYRVIFVNNHAGLLNVDADLSEYSKNENVITKVNHMLKEVLFPAMFLSGKTEAGVTHIDRLDIIQDKNGHQVLVKDDFLTELCKFYKSEDTTVITYLPQYANAVSKIRNELGLRVFYDCVDEMVGFESSKKVVIDEQNMISQCEGVIVTSRTLYVHKHRENENCILVPNGVTYENFLEPRTKPTEHQLLNGPIIGYVGAIAHWFDQELVAKIAEQNKNWNIVLVGTVYTDVSLLERYSNIYLLGRREYEEVPAYMQHFDVGIIPFKMTDLIVNCNPIKYYEYISAGLPVVSVPMPELMEEPYVRLAASHEQFSSAINELLNGPKTKVDIAFLESNSWSQRTQQIIEFIEGTDNALNHRDKLSQLAESYVRHAHDQPIMNVLAAEVLDLIGSTEDAKKQMNIARAGKTSVCLKTQLRLALEWDEVDQVKSILEIIDGDVTRVDSDFWMEKGKPFLYLLALRKLDLIYTAFELSDSLVKQDLDVIEEVGNLLFDIEQYAEAAKYYSETFSRKRMLSSVEATLKFAKIAFTQQRYAFIHSLLQQHIDKIDMQKLWGREVERMTANQKEAVHK